MAGAPMSQIAIAEPLAHSGETVCSPEAFKELKRYLKTGCFLPVESEHAGYMLVSDLKDFKRPPMYGNFGNFDVAFRPFLTHFARISRRRNTSCYVPFSA